MWLANENFWALNSVKWNHNASSTGQYTFKSIQFSYKTLYMKNHQILIYIPIDCVLVSSSLCLDWILVIGWGAIEKNYKYLNKKENVIVRLGATFRQLILVFRSLSSMWRTGKTVLEMYRIKFVLYSIHTYSFS